MKTRRIATLLFALTLALNAFSQNHLKFEGIPICGIRDCFVSQLEQKNFKLVGTQNDITILHGPVYSFSDCTVTVATLSNRDEVFSIGVMFPETDIWSELEYDYTTLKCQLSQEYGTPVFCIEKFENGKHQDEVMNMQDLSMNKCNYKSTFQTENGKVELQIFYSYGHTGNYGYVNLRYADMQK